MPPAEKHSLTSLQRHTHLGGGQVDDDIIREFPVVEGEPLGNGEAPAVRDVVEESVVVVGDLGVWEGALSSVVADPPPC